MSKPNTYVRNMINNMNLKEQTEGRDACNNSVTIGDKLTCIWPIKAPDGTEIVPLNGTCTVEKIYTRKNDRGFLTDTYFQITNIKNKEGFPIEPSKRPLYTSRRFRLETTSADIFNKSFQNI